MFSDDASAEKWFVETRWSNGNECPECGSSNVQAGIGMESFWSVLERAHKGTFHKISHKHLNRYVTEFAGRHNVRPLDTIEQMRSIARGMVGKQLKCEDLIV